MWNIDTHTQASSLSLPLTGEVPSRVFSPSDRGGGPCLGEEPAQGMAGVPHLSGHLLPDGLVITDWLREGLHVCMWNRQPGKCVHRVILYAVQAYHSLVTQPCLQLLY